MRLIDADELRRKMCYKCIDTDEETEKGRVKWDSGLWIRYKVFEDAVILAPTVDAERIRHGHWIDHTYKYRFPIGRYECSICGAAHDMEWDYRPNCGAKMDEEEVQI